MELTGDLPSNEELIALYAAVGWSAYALMTDDEPRQQAFYRSLGLSELTEVAGGRLRAFVRIQR